MGDSIRGINGNDKIQLKQNLKTDYLSQTDDHCQEAKPQQTELLLWRMTILQLILCIRIKRRNISGMGYIKIL